MVYMIIDMSFCLRHTPNIRLWLVHSKG